MANRIQNIEILTTRFDLNEIELTIHAEPERFSKDLKLKGRLMGPRCLYSETIEIAYQLRPLAARDGVLRAKVIIPEPSLWEPTTPFLYAGPLELDEAGETVDRAFVAHGVRHLALGTRGLRINGHPLMLEGVHRQSLDEVDAHKLRHAGRNLVLAAPAAIDLWESADRMGFLMLGILDRESENAAEAVRRLSRHTSAFGWLVRPDFREGRSEWFTEFLRSEKRTLVGVELQEPPTEPLPAGVAFVTCHERYHPRLAEVALPKLLLCDGVEANGTPRRAAADVLGWVG